MEISHSITEEMLYFLMKRDGTKIPVFVLDQDGKSLKIANMQGDTRWIKYSEFMIVNFNILKLF